MAKKSISKMVAKSLGIKPKKLKLNKIDPKHLAVMLTSLIIVALFTLAPVTAYVLSDSIISNTSAGSNVSTYINGSTIYVTLNVSKLTSEAFNNVSVKANLSGTYATTATNSTCASDLGGYGTNGTGYGYGYGTATNANCTLSFSLASAGNYSIDVFADGSLISYNVSTLLVEAPNVTLSAASGVGGTQLTATVQVFGPSETVTLTINGVSMGSGTSNASGYASFGVGVPTSVAAGAYTVIATGGTSGRVATVSFTVDTSGSSGTGSSTTSTTTTTTITPLPITPTEPTPTEPTPTEPAPTEPTPVTTIETVLSEATTTINSAETAITEGDTTTATSLLTATTGNLDSLISTESTAETLDQVETTTQAVLDTTASLIEAGATEDAATVLTSVNEVADSLVSSDNPEQASSLVSGVLDQASSLLAAGATTEAETALTNTQAISNKLVESTTAAVDDLTDSNLDVADTLGLDDLGLTTQDIVDAQDKQTQASDLLIQAAAETDDTQKSALLVEAQKLQKEALELLPEVKTVAKETVSPTVTSDSVSSALNQATETQARDAITSVQNAASTGGTVAVRKDLKSFHVSNKEKTDTTVENSVISLAVRADRDLTDVILVETISKDIAQSAAELAFTGEKAPTVLQADPIVSWTFDTISAGETKTVQYSVKKLVTELSTVTLAGGSVPAVVEPTAPEPTPEPEQADLTPVIVILVVLAIIGGAYMYLSKPKKRYPGFKRRKR